MRIIPPTLGTWNVYTPLERADTDKAQRRTSLIRNKLARYNTQIAAFIEISLQDIVNHMKGVMSTPFWNGMEVKNVVMLVSALK